MIQLIKIEKSYSNGLGGHILAFVDNIYVGTVVRKYKETDEYLEFMSRYETMSKQERMESNVPARHVLDFYIPYASCDSLSQQRCFSLEELELFFRNQLSVDFVSKLQEFLGNKVVPI